VDDKTGFFEAIVAGLGEERGIEFLKTALAEYAALSRPSDEEMEIKMHLSRFLLQKGAVQEGRSDRIILSV
jgi:hypothetical protein